MDPTLGVSQFILVAEQALTQTVGQDRANCAVQLPASNHDKPKYLDPWEPVLHGAGFFLCCAQRRVPLLSSDTVDIWAAVLCPSDTAP